MKPLHYQLVEMLHFYYIELMIHHLFYSKRRFEYFSDTVMAIIAVISILQIPVGNIINNADVQNLFKNIFIYLINFFLIGIFWNRHHKVIDMLELLSKKIIWINHCFLFILSLLPVFTRWIIENPFDNIPIVSYNITFLTANVLFIIMSRIVLRQTDGSVLKEMKTSINLRYNKNYNSINYIFSGLIAIGLIILLFIKPAISIFLFIILPIIMSFINVFYEEKRIREKINKRRKVLK